jgi:hypothetical protein
MAPLFSSTPLPNSRGPRPTLLYTAATSHARLSAVEGRRRRRRRRMRRRRRRGFVFNVTKEGHLTVIGMPGTERKSTRAREGRFSYEDREVDAVKNHNFG